MNRFVLMAVSLLVLASAPTQQASFYDEPVGLFSTRPSETASLNQIKRFGPVGISIDLIQPAFTMRIAGVEPGSPAEQTGALKAEQIIEAINGQPLAKIDPRIQLGRVLAEAEATDGVIRLAIKGVDEPVVVKVPVLGAYSETWPLNCPKSDKIVRQVADYLSGPKANEGLGGIGMLFLLSTGEEKDLEVVRQWARTAPAHKYPWYLGYGGIPLAECYLRTGDQQILENIQRWVDNAVKSQHLDAWAGRGSALTTYGNGHLNAAGTHVLTFLLLAKECGADVPDHTLHGALRHFYRYAGRGGNPYGDNRPGGGFVDNGKNGKLAFAMAAAAALTPEGEDSVYAKARDLSAMYSFYSTTFMLHGHTGGGIGEIWRSAAMGLLHDKKPKQYREFMDHRKWHYDLSRRFDGSFGILGGSGYDKEQWGVAYPLAYTIPRKTLRITGAPPTEFSNTYQLPKQPWGNDADDVFLSLDSVADGNGQNQDLSGETLARDSSMHLLRSFHGSEQPSDDEIRRLIRHPEHNIRIVAAHKALGINYGYIGWKKPGGKVRSALVMEFLKHEDPRVRRAMFGAMLSRKDQITSEVYALAVAAVKDPDESWWVKDAALQIVGTGSADQIVPLTDLLLTYLTHEEDWLKNAALTALSPVAADERVYRKVLPAMGDLIRSNQRISITRGLAGPIRSRIKNAPVPVQDLARETLQEAYTGYAGSKTAEGGLDTTSTHDLHIEAIAESLADVPGGLDVLYEIARQRRPDEILPHKSYFLNADPTRFGPKLRAAMIPIINDELIPEHVGRNRVRIEQAAAMARQSPTAGGRNDPIDQLVALHQRAGNDDYGWQVVSDLRNAEWNYLSFDPIKAEQVPWDQMAGRYREVTEPKGSEKWFAEDFDARAAGWKRGKSPFGQYMGKLPKPRNGCLGPGCYCGTPTNTLWEKEVLTLQGRFKLPEIEEGYRYRIRVNDGNHVGEGGGYSIYINGDLLIENPHTNGRGSGGLPKGAFITKDFFKHFDGGEVTIAMQTFIKYSSTRYPPKSRTPQGRFSIHIERQKLPPMGSDLVIQSARVVPMLTSVWQQNQGEENKELDSDAGKFVYDGSFKNNKQLMGQWKALGQVPEIDAFTPDNKRLRRGTVPNLTFNGEGTTSDKLLLWSGDMLIDLYDYEALKVVPKSIDGNQYLFIEAGGFSTRHKPGWKSAWNVLERQ